MRKLTGHRVNPANDKLTVDVLDEAGDGGACHHYLVSGFDTNTNESGALRLETRRETAMSILFQNGAIPEKGVNGLTQEVLLEEAQRWLHSRTLKRMQRGVEGTLDDNAD